MVQSNKPLFIKKIIFALIIPIIITSCTKTDVRIVGVEFHGNKIYDDYSETTQILDSTIMLGADFIVDKEPIQAFVKSTLLNPLIEDKLILTSNKDFYLDDDTIRAGENMLVYFEFKKLQKNYYMLSYNFKNVVNFTNADGVYKFYFTAPLSDNTEVKDSCEVTIIF